VTEFPLANPSSQPDGIAVGPDGKLWFTEYNAAMIGTIDTAGAIEETATPTASSSPETIVAAPDGNLWFTESATGQVGRETTAGVITEFPAPSAATPDGITVGPDGNLWFTEYSGQRVARLLLKPVNVLLLPSAPSPKNVTASQGSTVAWTLANPGPHRVADQSGLAQFDSGTQSSLSYFAHRFTAAGTYPYIDTATLGKGSVSVPVIVRPTHGTTTGTFTITWATTRAPVGLRYEVQVERPGATTFTPWKKGVAPSATFVPDAGAGTYRFRARVRIIGLPTATPYSPTLIVTVT
jgi:sugar lactone lactonase YvrE